MEPSIHIFIKDRLFLRPKILGFLLCKQAHYKASNVFVRGTRLSMPGDDQCLFHAVAHGLGGKSTAADLRSRTMDFAVANARTLLVYDDIFLNQYIEWESNQHAPSSRGRRCFFSKQHAPFSRGRRCFFSKQHAPSSRGRLCFFSKQHAPSSRGRLCSFSKQHAPFSRGRRRASFLSHCSRCSSLHNAIPLPRARNRDLTHGHRSCSSYNEPSLRGRSRAAVAADDIAEREDSGGCERKNRGCAADGGTARNVQYTVGASRVGHRRRRAGASIDDSRRADRNPPELVLLTRSVFLRLVVIVSCLLLC